MRFRGTGSKTVVTDPGDICKCFDGAILTRRPRAAPISSSEVMVLSDTAVLIAGLNTSMGVLDGKTFGNPGRVIKYHHECVARRSREARHAEAAQTTAPIKIAAVS